MKTPVMIAATVISTAVSCWYASCQDVLKRIYYTSEVRPFKTKGSFIMAATYNNKHGYIVVLAVVALLAGGAQGEPQINGSYPTCIPSSGPFDINCTVPDAFGYIFLSIELAISVPGGDIQLVTCHFKYGFSVFPNARTFFDYYPTACSIRLSNQNAVMAMRFSVGLTSNMTQSLFALNNLVCVGNYGTADDSIIRITSRLPVNVTTCTRQILNSSSGFSSRRTTLPAIFTIIVTSALVNRG